MEKQGVAQSVPVRMYRTDDRLTVAVPMPGLEPEDIVVEVTGDGMLQLHGELRGELKDVKDVLLNEWNVDHYQRDLRLPSAVNAELANATYGNGVLVVVLPLADQTRAARLTLQDTGLARGQRVGHTGSPIEPTSTEKHRAAIAERNAGR